MSFSIRIRAAARASLKHLVGSLIVAALAAFLVFGLWYPYPYDALVGGQNLFLILISVDVVCGPLLTLVVFNPKKPRRELWRDIGVVVALQLAALAYGLNTVAHARPVFLAFEKDLFRIVCLPEVDSERLSEAPPELREPGWSGPRLIGVRIEQPGDPDYLKAVEMGLNGIHNAFRPGSWRDYGPQRSEVIAKAKPMTKLRTKYPEQKALIDEAVKKSGLPNNRLGYLPLSARMITDWVVLVDLSDGEPKGFLPLDGWD